jgi:DNA-binding beta-propeller fold protein YncE
MSRKLIVGALIVYSCFPENCTLQAQPQDHTLQLISSIPLPNVLGRIDHMAFESKRQFVYIAALGNNTVEIVDLKNKKVVHSIKELREPQGVAYIPENNSIFVSNGYNGECDFFDAESFTKIKSIKLSGDADNVRYDSIDKRIYVGYGEGGMAVIDAMTFNLITEIKLSGHPESFQIDRTENKIYVNIPFENQIEIIDLKLNQVTEKWKLQSTANFPMSLDEINKRLYIGSRHPAKLLVVDTATGKIAASFDSDNDVDDVYYDKKRKRIYMSCGDGNIDVFQQFDANTYKALGKVTTHTGARTSLFIPGLDQFIVAFPSSGFNSIASLLIYSLN